MPRLSMIEQLPANVRRALEARMVRSQFGKIQSHVDWLASQGHQVGRSAVGHFSKGLKAYHEALRSPPPADLLSIRVACLQVAAQTGTGRDLLQRAEHYVAWVIGRVPADSAGT